MLKNIKKSDKLTRKDVQGFWGDETKTLEEWYKSISKESDTEKVETAKMINTLKEYANNNEFHFVKEKQGQ
ncbi:hypothetical protein EFP_129 [Enterococcus phage EF24C]|uniref:Uncharacterized protein n=2 Tax=Kochikohdavirus TaxID=2560160 RepID=A8E2I1_BPPHE|nr:hypothetical protein EFP_gp129 [Enterococcus phage EF24C]UQT00365.1 hypothetical protein FGBNBECL_00007 [Enterococcus phage vB_OCPT_Bob]BAF81397.1 hypothetical protein EFP_129 [Enterococcus phage EF24C]